MQFRYIKFNQNICVNKNEQKFRFAAIYKEMFRTTKCTLYFYRFNIVAVIIDVWLQIYLFCFATACIKQQNDQTTNIYKSYFPQMHALLHLSQYKYVYVRETYLFISYAILNLFKRNVCLSISKYCTMLFYNPINRVYGQIM